MAETRLVAVDFDDPAEIRRWVDELTRLLPDLEVAAAGDAAPERVSIAVVGNIDGRRLHRFPNLDLIQSSWAGVDRLIVDAPDVPIARMVAPRLTRLMTEFVTTAVLMLHRDVPAYRRAQTERSWEPRDVRATSDRKVGVLGYGELGSAAARALLSVGFEVEAWARTEREGKVRVWAGSDGLHRLVGGVDILVNLLPLTPDTRHILARPLFERMRGGTGLVNVGRGAHVVVSDLIDAIHRGRVGEAILDVFEQEPLPEHSPLWTHPRVTVFPHVAAPTIPEDLAPEVVANLRRYLSGEQPRFLVSR